MRKKEIERIPYLGIEENQQEKRCEVHRSDSG